MVISSRTTGITVLRPSSSSMMSFMEDLEVRGESTAPRGVGQSRLLADEGVHLRAVVGAVGQVFLQILHRVGLFVQVCITVPEAAVHEAQRVLVGGVLVQRGLGVLDG